MSEVFKKFHKGIVVQGNSADPSDNIEGSLFQNSTSSTLKVYINGAVREVVNASQSQTLTNKTLGSTNTLTGATAASFTNSGTITLPTSTDTLVGRATSDVLTNKTLSGNTATNLISGSGTFTLNTTGTITAPNTTDTLVGKATSDVLTNKTLSGNTATNLISGAGTFTFNTTGTLTAPNATDTLVGKATSDVLTNKTLSGNTATNLVSGSGSITFNTTGAITVPNATDTLVGKATSDVLTNKTLTGNTAVNLISGSGTLTLNTSGTVTLPNATDTLVGKATSDTLTNKTLTTPEISDKILFDQIATPSNPASTKNLLYFKSDNSLYSLDSGGTETQVGSGASSGSKNYITNSGAESNTTGWATYADAAGASPVDGTGGSPALTLTRSTSTPLRGTGSFLITKDAANRQGQGASYDFTIDVADKAKILQISFDYAIASGTYVGNPASLPSDLTVYIYDVTNAVIIQPAGYSILGATQDLPQKYIGTFQTASNSTSYRLIFHVATTSASAYTIKMDDVSVGPQIVQYGAAVTDWIAYTPTLTGSGGTTWSNQTTTGQYRRVGDSVEVEIYSTFSGAPGTASGAFNWSLPSGLAADTSKLPVNSIDNVLGFAYANDSSTTFYTGSVTFNSVTGPTTLTAYTNSTSNTWRATIPFTIGNGDNTSIKAIVPIQGWSSTVQMSNDTDTRVVAAYGTQQVPTSSLTTGFTTTIFGTVTSDSHAAYNVSTGVYTVPVSGYYNVSSSVELHGTYTSGQCGQVAIYLNGALQESNNAICWTSATSQVTPTISGIVKCTAGDSITIRATAQGSSLSYTANFSGSNFSIQRLSGPASIAASESVNATVHGTSTSLSGSTVDIVFNTKVFDSHNAYSTTTGLYTVPVSGKYLVTSTIQVSGTISLNNNVEFYIAKNGAAVGLVTLRAGGVVTNLCPTLSIVVSCVAGDTLSSQADTNITSPSINGGNIPNFISICRVGN